MFCLNYYPYQKYVQEADELKIKYRPADRTLKDFLETFQKKSIVIDVTNNFENIDAQLFKSLYKKYKNFKLIIDFNNKEHLQRVTKSKIPYFFSNFVTSIDQLTGLIPYYPTDMYICEELGFSLDKISQILHANNIKIRVFPNICQSSFPETNSIKTFFIRPEDIPAYSEFVDVFQLISDEGRQGVLFKIYKQKKWIGELSEIIPSFKESLIGLYIINGFGEIRAKCGKRCLYKPGSCSICDRFVELSNIFEQNDIIVRKEKPVD